MALSRVHGGGNKRLVRVASRTGEIAAPRRMFALFTMSDASDEHINASIIWNDVYLREKGGKQ